MDLSVPKEKKKCWRQGQAINLPFIGGKKGAICPCSRSFILLRHKKNLSHSSFSSYLGPSECGHFHYCKYSGQLNLGFNDPGPYSENGLNHVPTQIQCDQIKKDLLGLSQSHRQSFCYIKHDTLIFYKSF
jgi:hypothetical protein